MLAACDARGLALVPLVAPTTTPERLAAIGARARGFLYTVSVVGTTGERDALGERFAEVVARAKASTEVPVALGFGISTPEQARQAADAGADGVIVGTRLVRAAGESEDPARGRRRARRRTRGGPSPAAARIPRGMGLILTATAGLVVWIVLWALGTKGFDAFMLAAAIILRRRVAEDPLRLPARPSQLTARVRARWLCLAALAAGASGAAGCGGTGADERHRNGGQPAGRLLEPAAAGPVGGRSPTQIVNGEKLALAQAGGRVGPFRVSYVSLDDANPTTGKWSPDVTATDAKIAAQDTSTIAYLGDYNSAATAVSLPLINAAGHPAGQPVEPLRRPHLLARRRTGRARTLLSERAAHLRAPAARAIPAQARGAGAADAVARRAQGLRARRPGPVRDAARADRRRRRRTRRRSRSPAHDSLATAAGASFTGEVEKVVESGAQAVFFAGAAGPGRGRAVDAAARARTRACCCSGRARWSANRSPRRSGRRRASTYLTTPGAAPRLYPPLGPARARATTAAPSASEAGALRAVRLRGDDVVLDAIRSAGSRGNDRQAVIDSFFARQAPRLGARPLLDRSRRRNRRCRATASIGSWRAAASSTARSRPLARRPQPDFRCGRLAGAALETSTRPPAKTGTGHLGPQGSDDLEAFDGRVDPVRAAGDRGDRAQVGDEAARSSGLRSGRRLRAGRAASGRRGSRSAGCLRRAPRPRRSCRAPASVLGGFSAAGTEASPRPITNLVWPPASRPSAITSATGRPVSLASTARRCRGSRRAATGRPSRAGAPRAWPRPRVRAPGPSSRSRPRPSVPAGSCRSRRARRAHPALEGALRFGVVRAERAQRQREALQATCRRRGRWRCSRPTPRSPPASRGCSAPGRRPPASGRLRRGRPRATILPAVRRARAPTRRRTTAAPPAAARAEARACRRRARSSWPRARARRSSGGRPENSCSRPASPGAASA